MFSMNLKAPFADSFLKIAKWEWAEPFRPKTPPVVADQLYLLTTGSIKCLTTHVFFSQTLRADWVGIALSPVAVLFCARSPIYILYLWIVC